MIRTREQIALLSSGDRLFVSTEVADYRAHLHAIGVSGRMVQLEHDMWILVQSVSLTEAANLIDDKRN